MAGTRSLVVGLTGGIGTGKSKVSELLERLGAAVDCSDKIVRELQAPGGAGLRAIVEEFGRGVPDARAASSIGPSSASACSRIATRALRLNLLIHPLVTAEHQRRLAAHRARGVPVVVADIPLLLEGRKAGVGTRRDPARST